MDLIANPFSPDSLQPELVGRDSILEDARILLGRIKNKKSEKSMLLTGLRGVGKTVLLNEIKHLAESMGYRTVFIESRRNKDLRVVLVPHLRGLLYELDRMSGIGNKVKRGLAILRSFIGSLQLTVSDVTFGLDINPEMGVADSGDLESDLPYLFSAIAEAAEERKCAIAIFIDEAQEFSHKELGALIMAMHRIQQQSLPLVLVGAGLPVLPRMAGESKSYVERLFNFPDIGALSKEDTFKALRDPVQAVGVDFEQEALKAIYDKTKGYPYFLQEWGYQCWNLATTTPITLQVVHNATEIVIGRLDKNFFKIRFDRLTPSERNFLRAMAEIASETYRTGDIASILNVKISALGPLRASLIKKGMIYSPAYGDMAFTVPLFDDFILRTIPKRVV